MKVLILVLWLMSSFSVSAAEFCQRTRADITEALSLSAHRIDQKNGGGFFNGGVCWWHSRMQRSSIYLAQYEPGLPRPSSKEAILIFQQLKVMNRVVTIPGYEDFNSFTRDFKPQLQAVLEQWQRQDGIINFEWMRGISGSSRLPAAELKNQMKKVHHFFIASPMPIWIMAQMKGIIAHSFLIRKMQPLADGYLLEVIDSNKPKDLRLIRYTDGDQSLKLEDVKNPKPFVPYVGFQEDFVRIQKAIKSHCSDKTLMETGLFPAIIEPGLIEPNLQKRR